jgi:hypothetical protein
LHSVRNASLGRKCDNVTFLHPGRDASLPGCRFVGRYFFYRAIHPYGMRLAMDTPIALRLRSV